MMRMYDIILKKRNGETLSDREICFFVEGFTKGDIPDYQAAALLMAVYFQGMDERETSVLTMAMARSGDMVDLSAIPGIKVDKHSTGGVGDKTSLIVGPIVAACGVPVAKMSGRGLGHTGGTVDKMESIPGLETSIAKDRFFSIVKEIGLAIIGQTGNIAPADKKLYALRDVTATVDSLPLIASSIMSKKLAAGSDAILLDVKTGSGAFMKTLDDSIALAQAMVSIGERNGRKTMALVTDMDTPLGFAVGNALEIVEVADVLLQKGPADLAEVCLQLASNMLLLAGKGNLDTCRALAENALSTGKAFDKLCAMVTAQGGDSSILKETSQFKKAPVASRLEAGSSGYIAHMDTQAVGAASAVLGAGRLRKEDGIDHSAGIMLARKTGDRVSAGDLLATLHTANENRLCEAKKILSDAIVIETCPPEAKKPILARVTADTVEKF